MYKLFWFFPFPPIIPYACLNTTLHLIVFKYFVVVVVVVVSNSRLHSIAAFRFLVCLLCLNCPFLRLVVSLISVYNQFSNSTTFPYLCSSSSRTFVYQVSWFLWFVPCLFFQFFTTTRLKRKVPIAPKIYGVYIVFFSIYVLLVSVFGFSLGLLVAAMRACISLELLCSNNFIAASCCLASVCVTCGWSSF